jgi:hypothetical protein
MVAKAYPTTINPRIAGYVLNMYKCVFVRAGGSWRVCVWLSMLSPVCTVRTQQQADINIQSITPVKPQLVCNNANPRCINLQSVLCFSIVL